MNTFEEMLSHEITKTLNSTKTFCEFLCLSDLVAKRSKHYHYLQNHKTNKTNSWVNIKGLLIMEFLADLHPKVIHFPIAFFILYFLFETTGIILKRDYLTKSAFIVLILGLFFSLLSVLTGNQAHQAVKQVQIDAALYNDLIEQHELFATITLWYFVAVSVFRTYLLVNKKFVNRIRYIFIILGLVGSLLIYLTGTYGGELVFKYGIGTKLF